MNKSMAAVVVLTVAFLLIVPSLFAQNASEGSMGLAGYGIKGGLSESKFTGSDASSTFGSSLKYRPSGAAGAFVTYRLTDLFAASLEPMWVQRGAKYDISEADGTHKFSTRVDYIDVPLLVKVSIPTNGNFHPDIFAGPDVAFRLDAKAKEDAPGFSQTANVKNDFKSADFGIAFGVGTRYDIGMGAISLDGRYYAGLTKIDNTSSSRSIRNGDFLVLVGYSFK